MRAGSCGGPESMEGETQRDERGGRLRFSVFRFKSMRKTVRENRVKHRCVVYIYRGEDWGREVHIHCTSSRQRLFFIRTHTFRITLSFLSYGVHICHMSKAAPVPVYFTQLSGEWLRLFLASVEERPFVHGNSQCNPVRFHKCLLDE